MPQRADASPPGKFIRDHLVDAGGVDYIQSIYRAYRKHLSLLKIRSKASRQSFSSYIWVANRMGLIVFDHAESQSRWGSVVDGEEVEKGYTKDPRPLAPSPRHYYRLVNDQDPRWLDMSRSYREMMGLPVPEPRVKKPKIIKEKVERPAAVEAAPVPWGIWVEGLPGLLNEEHKSASIKKLERQIDLLEEAVDDPDEVIEGLQDLRDAIEEYKDITKAGMSLEEYQDAKAEAWDSIVEAIESLEVISAEEEAKPARAPKKPSAQTHIFSYIARIREIDQKLSRFRKNPSSAEFRSIEGEIVSLGEEVVRDYEESRGKNREKLALMNYNLMHALEKLPLIQGPLTTMETDPLPARREEARKSITSGVNLVREELTGGNILD